MSSVLENIRKHASVCPHAIALDDGTRQFTYTELYDRVIALAVTLKQSGAKRIALFGDNSIEWVLVDLAAQMAEITLIPVPIFFSRHQIDHILKQAQVDLMIGGDASVLDDSSDLPSVQIECAPRLFCKRLGANSSALPGVAKVTFTSGSTGDPKGVCLTRLQMDQTAQALAEAVDTLPLGQHLSVMPFATLLENVAGIYVSLMKGACIHIRRQPELGFKSIQDFDFTRFIGALNHVNPDSLILVPQLLMALVTAAEFNMPLPRSLKFIAVGGGKISASLLEKAQRFQLPVYEGYGLSEAGSVVALNPVSRPVAGSVGKPLSHVQVRIAEDGEIMVSGNVMGGYLGMPESESGIVNGWLHTGDLGAIDEAGYLHVHGRKKNMYVSAFGRNVNPEWVESELTQQLSIAQAAVFGEASKTSVAVITVRGASGTTQVEQAITRVNERLPAYAQVQNFILTQEAFSLENGMATANGRIKREAIYRSYQNEIDAKLYPESRIYQQENIMSFYQTLLQETESARQHIFGAPVIQAVPEGRFDLDSYYYFLCQAFHHVKHTVPLMMACGARLPERYEWVRKALVEYIEEEIGHHEWILNDIEACGFDKEAVRNSQADTAIDLMVSYLYDCIQRKNPMGFFGMVLVLEGTSVQLAHQLGEQVQEKLNLPKTAFTYLYSHGELDQDHIQFFEGLMNKVEDPEDKQAIIDSARIVYRCYGDMLHAIPLRATKQETTHEAA